MFGGYTGLWWALVSSTPWKLTVHLPATQALKRQRKCPPRGTNLRCCFHKNVQKQLDSLLRNAHNSCSIFSLTWCLMEGSNAAFKLLLNCTWHDESLKLTFLIAPSLAHTSTAVILSGHYCTHSFLMRSLSKIRQIVSELQCKIPSRLIKLKLDKLWGLFFVCGRQQEELTSARTFLASRFRRSTCWVLISCCGVREQLTFWKACFSAWLLNWTYWSRSVPSHRMLLRLPGLGMPIIWKINTNFGKSWQTWELCIWSCFIYSCVVSFGLVVQEDGMQNHM